MPLARRFERCFGALGRGHLFAFMLGAGACSGEPAPTPACGELELSLDEGLGVSRESITLGSKDSIIGLSTAERNAVVLVEVFDAAESEGLEGGGAEPEGVLCSGVLVAERWVLTARHCFDRAVNPAARVAFGESETQPSFETRAAAVFPHTALDLAAVELELSPSRSVAAPIRVLEDVSSIEAAGMAVIAGFGITRDFELGERAFAAVDVVASDAQHFVTSGAPLSGACGGDSGGPLVTRDRDGAPVVLGVLSYGSGSCRALDHFVRLDAAGEFLALVPESAPPSELECDGLGVSGTCFSPGLAAWCEGSALRRESCAQGRACGWDTRAGGYRCVAEEDDACGEISSFGTCKQGVARRCIDGTAVENPCNGCGLECVRNPTTGHVGCWKTDAQ